MGGVTIQWLVGREYKDGWCVPKGRLAVLLTLLNICSTAKQSLLPLSIIRKTIRAGILLYFYTNTRGHQHVLFHKTICQLLDNELVLFLILEGFASCYIYNSHDKLDNIKNAIAY